MRPGHASETANVVCMARAAAHGRTEVVRFSDPTALEMLSEEARARVKSFQANDPCHTFKQRAQRAAMQNRSELLAVRTVSIDDAVRARISPQVVILGAGFDGRAWRMPELRDSVVFEIDHPDTQRIKRERLAALQYTAREVHFVSVDFAHDDLTTALASAGHDPLKPTTWIWEGVVMYLTLAQIESTLSVVHQRSSVGSRLIVAYMQPTWSLERLLITWMVRRLGEPLRSLLKPKQIRALLAKYTFDVVHDDDVTGLARALYPNGGGLPGHLQHARIVVADRVADALQS